MRRLLAVLLTVLVLAGSTGCSGKASQQEHMAGTWVTNLHSTYVAFNDDGTYGKGKTPEQALGTKFGQFEWGTWTLEEGLLTFATSQDSQDCTGAMGIYEVEIADTGDQVLVNLIDDTCASRIADFPSGLTRHIEP